MNRISIILISTFLFLFGAAKAQQSEKDAAPITVPQVVAGPHGGILITEGGNTMEYIHKGNFLIVFPDEKSATSSEMGNAKFTVVDENKTTVIENVAFSKGMYSAYGKKAFVNPKVKFEATINGKSCVMNFQIPSRQ